MRNWISFSPVGDRELFENKLYELASHYRHAAVLTDKYSFYNGSAHQYHDFDLLAGFEALDLLEGSLDQLQTKVASLNDWLFGYFSYDLKNHLEPGFSGHRVNDHFHFRSVSFFRPRFLIKREGDSWQLGFDSRVDSSSLARQFIARIQNHKEAEDLEWTSAPNFKARVSRSQYLEAVAGLLKHIHRGDIYEVNYCIEYFSHDTLINPAMVFERLQEVSPMPFSVLYKQEDSFLLGASPERYLRNKGARIISQPMKGTIQRNGSTRGDIHTMRALSESEKERAENIMVVDLVRNDLSRVASRGTVKVDDLCGIFPYPDLYQMVSTVSALLHSDAGWLDPIKVSFPMGSMTGTPKLSAMQLIERYEEGPRGLYSGAVGYITPQLDYDFNVVIRSLLYNQSSRYLSYSVGSAITAGCVPEKEYEECLLKASAWRKVFSQKKVTI